MLPLPQLHLREPVPVEVRLPRIALAAGITAGLTTLEGFERRHGKALRSMGGHSGGAGSWYVPRQGVVLHADGFNISKDGEILDGYRVEWQRAAQVGRTVPHIHLRRSELGLLAILRRGMSRRQAETALHTRLTGDAMHLPGLVRYVPKPVNKQNDRYTRWQLRLFFGPKGLEAFNVGCD